MGEMESASESSVELTPAEQRAVIESYLRDIGSFVIEDPEEASMAIVERILQAGSPDEVLQPAEPLKARELLGIPLEIKGFRFMRSSYGGREGVYAVIDAWRLDTGEAILVTCGGRNVLAQLYRLATLDALPVRVYFEQSSRPTDSGYFPLWLRPVVEARAGQRSVT